MKKPTYRNVGKALCAYFTHDHWAGQVVIFEGTRPGVRLMVER